jgi:tripartite-type tricarboxylate transporter receptor subunit TctC
MAMTMQQRRRRLVGALAAVVAVPAFGRALAQVPPHFPQRPVLLWVPWPAGGATDITMRLLADIAGRTLGQKVLVDNRPGAGGTLAMPLLQQAAPDGYTLAQLPQPVFRAPWIQKLGWDPIRDTTPVIQLSGVTFGMVVPVGCARSTTCSSGRVRIRANSRCRPTASAPRRTS